MAFHNTRPETANCSLLPCLTFSILAQPLLYIPTLLSQFISDNFEHHDKTMARTNTFRSPNLRHHSGSRTAGRKLNEPETEDIFDVLKKFNELERQIAAGTVTEPTEQQCLISIFISDTDRNSGMNVSEYLNFVNRLGRQTWAGATDFSQLPQTLQQNFYIISGDTDSINIFGAKPGQVATDGQKNKLLNLCESVVLTVNSILSPPPGTTPTFPAPTPQVPQPLPQPNPTLAPQSASDAINNLTPEAFQTCNDNMVNSDIDRNRYLDQDEYVEFCNKLSSGQLGAASFGDLSAGLQSRFFDLESGGLDGIPIEGARPGSGSTPSQNAFLELICVDVGRSVNIALHPVAPINAPISQTLQPTTQPTNRPPTAQPTILPTAVSLDTDYPTITPTLPPTPSPTSATTFVPPTTVPSSQATASPSSFPSLVTLLSPTQSPTTLAPIESTTTRSTSTNTALIVGVASGAVFLSALLCALGGYFFWRASRRSDKKIAMADEDSERYYEDEEESKREEQAPEKGQYGKKGRRESTNVYRTESFGSFSSR